MIEKTLCPKCKSEKIKILFTGFSREHRQVIHCCECQDCSTKIIADPYTHNILKYKER